MRSLSSATDKQRQVLADLVDRLLLFRLVVEQGHVEISVAHRRLPDWPIRIHSASSGTQLPVKAGRNGEQEDMANAAQLPEKMLAVAITQPGGPRVLKAEKRDLPVPDTGEILIRVHAAGVNRPDVQQRKGAYPPPPGASDLPGLEVSGEVAALGEGVTRWRVGDAVCALTPGGGYAEYARVHESNALPIPAGFTFTEAAALPETFFTVWHNVFERGALKAARRFWCMAARRASAPPRSSSPRPSAPM